MQRSKGTCLCCDCFMEEGKEPWESFKRLWKNRAPKTLPSPSHDWPHVHGKFWCSIFTVFQKPINGGTSKRQMLKVRHCNNLLIQPWDCYYPCSITAKGYSYLIKFCQCLQRVSWFSPLPALPGNLWPQLGWLSWKSFIFFFFFFFLF